MELSSTNDIFAFQQPAWRRLRPAGVRGSVPAKTTVSFYSSFVEPDSCVSRSAETDAPLSHPASRLLCGKEMSSLWGRPRGAE